jgi:ribonuclease P protein component
VTYPFPKSARLLKRRQFERLGKSGFKKAGRSILIEFQNQSTNAPKLGVTVTKRYGKAHDRNRFKRLVREAFRLCRHLLPMGIEINVRPKNGQNPTLETIKSDLLYCLIKK